LQTGKESFPALRRNAHFKTVESCGNIPASTIPNTGSGTREERRIFRQDLVRCDDSVWRKRTADVYGADICWIIDIRQGSPIKRVGKNGVHGFLLGTP
jgi:hypothetical protein